MPYEHHDHKAGLNIVCQRWARLDCTLALTYYAEPVLEGLTGMHQFGQTNKRDLTRVAQLSSMLGYLDTAQWIRASKWAFSLGLFHRF